MSAKYVFHPLAQGEYEDSLEWYLKRSPQAARNFVNAVNEVLEKICETPYRWRNEFEHFHELALKKYPFVIIYSIEEDGKLVVICAVHHFKKESAKKYRT